MDSARAVPLERLGWLVLLVGGPAAVVAAALEPAAARSAAAQDWPPFVLVAGLLLIGMVARDEGIFAKAGTFLASFGRSGMALLVAAAVVVALVTVTLNLDTAVTFLTPVVLAAARHRRRDPEPFLYLVLVMANGSSLLLPGSNLTNLIVLHDTHQSGASFVAQIGPAWAASIATVLLMVVVLHRRRITDRLPQADGAAVGTPSRPIPATLGIFVAVVAMLALPAGVAALVVAADGVVLTLAYGQGGRHGALRRARDLNAPLLAGLLGTALALGVLGRVWSGPARLVAHAGPWQTAGIGAAAAVLVNNLPAASLLAARPVTHASALLVGLNLGPNLWLYGSLAGVLWFQSARGAGWTPSIRRFSLFGLAMVPATMAAALGALGATH